MKIDDLFLTAVQSGNYQLTKQLVEEGVNVNHRDGLALASAACNGYLEIVEYLVAKGADINADNNQPLSTAVFWKQFPVIKFLILKGAHVDKKILDDARVFGTPEIVEFLLKNK